MVKHLPTTSGGLNPWFWKIPLKRAWHFLQYSCLENSMGRGAWRATDHGATKSQTQLNRHSKIRGQSALDRSAFADLSVQQKHLGVYENAGSAPKYVWIRARHSVFLTSS